MDKKLFSKRSVKSNARRHVGTSGPKVLSADVKQDVDEAMELDGSWARRTGSSRKQMLREKQEQTTLKIHRDGLLGMSFLNGCRWLRQDKFRFTYVGCFSLDSLCTAILRGTS